MVKPVAVVEHGVVEIGDIQKLRDAGYEVVMAYSKEGVVLNDRTLRDEFAMAALASLKPFGSKEGETLADRCYAIADEMLRARG